MRDKDAMRILEHATPWAGSRKYLGELECGHAVEVGLSGKGFQVRLMVYGETLAHAAMAAQAASRLMSGKPVHFGANTADDL